MLESIWNWWDPPKDALPKETLAGFARMVPPRSQYLKLRAAALKIQRWHRRREAKPDKEEQERLHLQDLRVYLKRRNTLYLQIHRINGLIAQRYLA